jgi:protein NirF
MRLISLLLTGAILATALAAPAAQAGDRADRSAGRATGDLGLVVERAGGSVKIVDRSAHAVLETVSGLGDLSHASVVYSPDERYAYVFGRDGGLTKVDMIEGRIARRIKQAGNAIGGAISQDGELIAVSNYEPGGVKVFDAETLEQVASIPAAYGPDKQQRSKVVGLVDAPGDRFVFALYDAGEIWIADFSNPDAPTVTRHRGVGDRPYDGMITPDGRYYLAGLYGEDGVALIDLWETRGGVRRILDDYGRGHADLPVYKMPHLEGWAEADDKLFLPAVGQEAVLVVDTDSWEQVGRIETHGQPVFAVARPDGREVWVNFAHPKNDTVQVIDVKDLAVADTLHPGKAVLHIAFAPRGEEVWLSARDSDAVKVYDTHDREPVASLPVESPSGIFFTARAHEIGL